MVKWHKSDLFVRMYCNIEGGKKIAMPRYYKDKIYTRNVYDPNDDNRLIVVGERERIALYAKIESEAREAKLEADMIKRYGDDWVRTKVETHFSLFTKMYKDAESGRFTI